MRLGLRIRGSSRAADWIAIWVTPPLMDMWGALSVVMIVINVLARLTIGPVFPFLAASRVFIS